MLGIADRPESVSQVALDHKMKFREFLRPLYLHSVNNRCSVRTYGVIIETLKSLQREHGHFKREKALGQIRYTLHEWVI
jgi:hypothetical protein